MTTVAEPLLTAEEYARTSDPDDRLTELVDGRIVTFPFHGFRHGVICGRLCSLIGAHVAETGSGHAFVGTGIIARRDPDTVRGADYSYVRRERYDLATSGDDYFSIPPDLIFEVLEHDERWSAMLVRVAEYLAMEAPHVSVIDPESETISVFRPDARPAVLGPGDDWSAPEILGEFHVPVRRFFE
jgi:Uma2 family endonuclease